jgi:excisionase family DNA binding protein
MVCYHPPMDLKSKREAATILGLSTRGVERAVQRGHLTVLYRDSKHGKQAWFRAQELERLKQAQQNRGSVGFTSGIPFHPPGSPPVGTLVPMVEVESRRDKDTKKDAQVVPVADRLTLTVDDAAQLSGLPRSFIVENIHSQKLKAIKIGRRHYMKRADLNEFVHQL